MMSTFAKDKPICLVMLYRALYESIQGKSTMFLDPKLEGSRKGQVKYETQKSSQ